jgi:hypothetical protein
MRLRSICGRAQGPLGKLDEIGPLPDNVTVHLDAGYNSQRTRAGLASRRNGPDPAPTETTLTWHLSAPSKVTQDALARLGDTGSQRSAQPGAMIANTFFLM